MLLFRFALFGSSSNPETNFLYFNTVLHSNCYAYKADTKYKDTCLHSFPSPNHFCWMRLQAPYFRKQNIFLYIYISYKLLVAKCITFYKWSTHIYRIGNKLSFPEFFNLHHHPSTLPRLCGHTLTLHSCFNASIFVQQSYTISLLMPELNPSEQRCMLRFFTGDFKFYFLVLEKKALSHWLFLQI